MNAEDIILTVLEREDDQGALSTFLRIENAGSESLGSTWRLYFSLGLTPTSIENRVNQVLIDGRYGYLEPTSAWNELEPDDSILISLEPWLFSGMELVTKQGFWLTEWHGGNEETVLGEPTLKAPELVPLTKARNPFIEGFSPSCDANPQTPEHLFEKNLGTAAGAGELTIIPMVKHFERSGDMLTGAGFEVEGDTNEASYLKTCLQARNLLVAGGTNIVLSHDDQLPEDTYQLTTTGDEVEIKGGSSSAIFHGIQTFRQLLQAGGGYSLPKVTVKDQPDFEHRAFFLDIARHFQTADQIKKTIHAMAAYKMNRLQLGISNDEGWRLEVPGLPELTEVGSRRSFFHKDESGKPTGLTPAWGDSPDDHESFLTRSEFIDILTFAAAHHVDIILELNLPGHANALIRSMLSSGRFTIVDSDDVSIHRSAQGYTKNVVNPVLPDTYGLIEKLLTEFKLMYEEAKVAFDRIHLGGDEVPHGAWLHSPACHQSDVWDTSWNTDDDSDAKSATAALTRYYLTEVARIAQQVSPGIETGFWHEMSPYSTGEHSYFNGWTTEAGTRNLIDEILERDQQLVISNASYLYLDMPYGLHAEEPGLPWAAYIDTEMIYKFDPIGCWQIRDDRAHLVRGLQAQLWGETVYTPELMDFYTFPRLLAVAERAWNRDPVSANWSDFATAIGARELDHLSSLDVNFRIPPPGAKIINSQLHANVVFPDLEIRFTTDGSEPDSNSLRYEGPVNVDGVKEFRLATFYNNRRSRDVQVKVT